MPPEWQAEQTRHHRPHRESQAETQVTSLSENREEAILDEVPVLPVGHVGLHADDNSPRAGVDTR